MKLHSLKRVEEPDDKDEGKECADPCGEFKEPDYPYGTKLCLDPESLKAMGIMDLPDVGVNVTIEARGIITLASSESLEGEVTQRLEIQITDLGLSLPPVSLANRMYPKKKD